MQGLYDLTRRALFKLTPYDKVKLNNLRTIYRLFDPEISVIYTKLPQNTYLVDKESWFHLIGVRLDSNKKQTTIGLNVYYETFLECSSKHLVDFMSLRLDRIEYPDPRIGFRVYSESLEGLKTMGLDTSEFTDFPGKPGIKVRFNE